VLTDWMFFGCLMILSTAVGLMVPVAVRALLDLKGLPTAAYCWTTALTEAAGYLFAANQPAFVSGTHWSPLWWLLSCFVSVLCTYMTSRTWQRHRD